MMIWRKIKNWWSSWNLDTIWCLWGLHECRHCDADMFDINFYCDHIGNCVCKHCDKVLDPY